MRESDRLLLLSAFTQCATQMRRGMASKARSCCAAMNDTDRGVFRPNIAVYEIDVSLAICLNKLNLPLTVFLSIFNLSLQDHKSATRGVELRELRDE